MNDGEDEHWLPDFITHLGQTKNIHFKTVQDLARYSTPILTARYTHGFKGDEITAGNSLPNFSGPGAQFQRPSGLDAATRAHRAWRNGVGRGRLKWNLVDCLLAKKRVQPLERCPSG